MKFYKMKNLIKKWFGIDKLEKQKEEALAAAEVAINAAKEAKEAAELSKKTPKEQATARGEPWVAVLDTHVNQDNVRNGFFELDWNDLFVVQLKEAGYGFDGDPDEEIVDRWFRDLARNMLTEEGLDPIRRGAGFINVIPIDKNKSIVE
jgi:hypothetical protein